MKKDNYKRKRIVLSEGVGRESPGYWLFSATYSIIPSVQLCTFRNYFRLLSNLNHEQNHKHIRQQYVLLA